MTVSDSRTNIPDVGSSTLMDVNASTKIKKKNKPSDPLSEWFASGTD